MEIHVIRHTPVNFDKNRCYGQLDVPLADSFEKDAQEIAKKIAKGYDYIVSSPKTRCTQLAEYVELKNVNTDNRILELNFGDWEGQYWNEINQETLNSWMADFVNHSPTNGESLKQMYARVSDFVNHLRAQDYNHVLIITHAGVIRCFWAYFLDIPLKNIFKIPIHFNEVFKFNLGDDKDFDSIKQLK